MWKRLCRRCITFLCSSNSTFLFLLEFFSKKFTCTIYMPKWNGSFARFQVYFPHILHRNTIESVEILNEGTNTLTSNHVHFKNRLLNSGFFTELINYSLSIHIYLHNLTKTTTSNYLWWQTYQLIVHVWEKCCLSKTIEGLSKYIPDILTEIKNCFFKDNFWVWTLVWECNWLVGLENEKKIKRFKWLTSTNGRIKHYF